MSWFRENKRRYSDFHWGEINHQTLEAGRSVLEMCHESSKPTVCVIGFGFGRETEMLFRQGVTANVVGLDINRSRFHEAKKIRPTLFNEQLKPVVASMNMTPFSDESFDATLCLETMMHADSPEITLRELTRITKSEGLIIFNLSTTSGVVNDFVKMLRIEGVSRVVDRLRERIVNDEDSSSVRTKLYTRSQIQDLLQRNEHTQVVKTDDYLMGLSTYVVLKKD